MQAKAAEQWRFSRDDDTAELDPKLSSESFAAGAMVLIGKSGE